MRFWQVREEEALSGLSPSRAVVPPSGSPSAGAWRKDWGGGHTSQTQQTLGQGSPTCLSWRFLPRTPHLPSPALSVDPSP